MQLLLSCSSWNIPHFVKIHSIIYLRKNKDKVNIKAAEKLVREGRILKKSAFEIQSIKVADWFRIKSKIYIDTSGDGIWSNDLKK